MFFKRFKRSLGSVLPTNTLNEPPSAPKSLPQAPLAPEQTAPPAKRPRTDEDRTFPTTQAQFAPEGLGASHTPLRRPSASSTHSGGLTRKTGSVQSSNRVTSQTNVHEFRQIEKQNKVANSKRPRHAKSTKALDKGNSFTMVEDSDDDNTETPPLSSLCEFSDRFKRSSVPKPNNLVEHKNLKRKAATELIGLPKQPKNSSPDPLSVDGDHMRELDRTRVQTSLSESRRGEIKPTFKKPSRSSQFTVSHILTTNNQPTEIERAKAMLSEGLRIQKGVSGKHAYPGTSGECDEPFTLRVHEVSTILLPTSKQGESMEDYAYLAVDLKNIHNIRTADGPSCIVAISRAICTEKSGGPKLLMEFAERTDLDLFMKWVGMERAEPLTLDMRSETQGRLANELQTLSKAARGGSRALRDAAAAHPMVGDDIKLIERQRKMSQQRSRQLPPKRTERQTKLAARQDETATPRNKHLEDRAITIPESSTTPVTHQLRTRASRNRDPSPATKLWTEENPDWKKEWPSSLVFPAHGKNRATVDQDDISRLDEGEFLNDNLIIFGLRHLQDKLEREQPHIAERVHFHNTFFFDKLKPSKGSGGINYDSVKGWTSKVDLFTKDFIVVPINEHNHWYVAIIYNAPKLVPQASTSQTSAHAGPNIAMHNHAFADKSPTVSSSPIAGQNRDEPNDGASLVESEMRRMSISSSNGVNKTRDRDIQTEPHDEGTIEDAKSHAKSHANNNVAADDVEVEELRSGNTGSWKKSLKRASFGSRKHDPNQPKIITLDSLGSAHSPACSYLRQYIVAELKDKKGIITPDPGSLGMTAKGIPLQENYCDCGLYLLGYIAALLAEPDSFVQGLLRYEQPKWGFNSSEMRHELRRQLFELQKEQKEREASVRAKKQEKKRQAAMDRKNQSESASRPSSSGEKSPSQAIKLFGSATGPASAPRRLSQTEKYESDIVECSVDVSPMFRPNVAATDAKIDESVGTGIALPTTTPSAGGSNRPDSSNLSDADLLSGTVLTQITGSRMQESRSASDDTTTNFLQPLKSPEGDTSENPVELDYSSPDLTKDLRQDLRSVQKQQKKTTPRKAGLPLDADTPRKSVEQQEAASSPEPKITRTQNSTPQRSRTKHQQHSNPRSNIEVIIPTSRFRREREAASMQSSGLEKSAQENGLFRDIRVRHKGSTFSKSQYVPEKSSNHVTVDLDSDEEREDKPGIHG